MNAAEKARLAEKAARKQKQINREYSSEEFANIMSIVGGILSYILPLGLIVLSCIFIIKGLSTPTASSLKALKAFFWVGIVAFVLSIVTMCIHFHWSEYDANGFACFWGVLEIIGLIAFAVVFVITLISGKLKIDSIETHDQVVYALDEDGYRVIGAEKGATDIVIKEEINGTIVYQVDKRAFAKNKDIKTVVFEGVETNMYIAKKAFYECDNLTKVTFNGEDAEFDTYEVCYYSFSYCNKLETVEINNVTVAADIDNSDSGYCFSYGSSKLTIDLNNSNLFDVCGDIPTMKLSGTCNVGSNNPYTPVRKVTTIVFEDDFDFENSTIESSKGNFTGTELIYYPVATKIYLPANVTKIANNFFGNELASKKDVLRIYFAGTEEQWAQVVVGEEGNNNYSIDKVTFNTVYDGK